MPLNEVNKELKGKLAEGERRKEKQTGWEDGDAN